jgi:hypothetical protein
MENKRFLTAQDVMEMLGVSLSYRAMFEACKKRPWLRGFALWEWAPKLPSASEAWKDDSYEICEKPVQVIIKRFYEHEAGTSLM